MLSVLVVCTGNICRSPIAEALFRHRAPAGLLRVRSAGTWALEGNPAMPEGVSVLRERGIEPLEHRAAPVTRPAVEEADLVLTMTSEQRDEVLTLVPDAAARTFTLKELAALLPGTAPATLPDRLAAADALRSSGRAPEVRDTDVRDPIGLGIAAYRGVALDIEVAVETVLEALAEAPVEEVS